MRSWGVLDAGTETVKRVAIIDIRSITLGARQPITALLTDIWPQLAVGFRGKLLIRVSSGQPNSL
jgi:hypothetical protein